MTMTICRSVLFALLCLGVPALAADPSIEEKKNRADQEQRVVKMIQEVNKKCQTAIPDAGVMDWSTWKQAREGGHLSAVFCEYGINAVRNLCADKIAQGSIAKSLKKIVCQGDAADKTSAEVRGDTLVLHTSLTTGSANALQNQARDAVSKNLK